MISCIFLISIILWYENNSTFYFCSSKFKLSHWINRSELRKKKTKNRALVVYRHKSRPLAVAATVTEEYCMLWEDVVVGKREFWIEWFLGWQGTGLWPLRLGCKLLKYNTNTYKKLLTHYLKYRDDIFPTVLGFPTFWWFLFKISCFSCPCNHFLAFMT